MNRNRIIALDLAKGFLILLVVYGHAMQYSFGSDYMLSENFYDNIRFRSIYSFHMPMFMMISGYLFWSSNNKYNLKSLLFKKIISIGIPLLTFNFLCTIESQLSLLVKGNFINFLLFNIKMVIVGTNMWFLSSILLNIFIVSFISRIFERKLFVYLALSLLFLISLFIKDSLLLSVHKFMFPFFCIGYFFKDYNLLKTINNKIVIIILTLCSLIAIWWYDEYTYIYKSGWYIFDNMPYMLFINFKRLIIALIVSFSFIQYICIFEKQSGKLCWGGVICKIGQMSLFIYGFNILFDTYYIKILKYYDINFDYSVYCPVIFFIIVIFSGCFLYRLFERFTFSRAIFIGK